MPAEKMECETFQQHSENSGSQRRKKPDTLNLGNQLTKVFNSVICKKEDQQNDESQTTGNHREKIPLDFEPKFFQHNNKIPILIRVFRIGNCIFL